MPSSVSYLDASSDQKCLQKLVFSSPLQWDGGTREQRLSTQEELDDILWFVMPVVL